MRATRDLLQHGVMLVTKPWGLYLHQGQGVGQGCQHAKDIAIRGVIGRQGADETQEHAVVGAAVEVAPIQVSILLQLRRNHSCGFGHQRRSPTMSCKVTCQYRHYVCCVGPHRS